MRRHRELPHADGGSASPAPDLSAGPRSAGHRAWGSDGRCGGAGLLRALAVLATVTARAETRVDWLFPPGGQAGSSFEVRLTGHLSAWPLEVWTDDPELRFQAAAAPGHFQVTIGADAALGPHLVRFFEASSASAPCQFVVGESPEWTWPEEPTTPTAAETEKVSEAGKESPEPVSPPATLQGRLTHADPGHLWPLRLPGPVTVRAEAVASRLDSPGTVRLILLDTGGAVLGRSTNSPPTDPTLECLVAQPGLYQLRVLPLSGEGVAAAARDAPLIYRVTLTTREAGHATARIPAGTWLEGAPLPDVPTRVVIRELPVAPEPVLHPETLSPTTDFTGTFGGFINPPGDQDRFGFQTRREQVHRFRARAVNPDSNFLPVLRVLTADGTPLAESVPGLETALEWTAPADGNYVLVVADAFDSGGPDYGYELELVPPQPRVTATAPGHTWHLPPGGRLTVPVQVRRPDSYRGPLTLTASGLPASVTAGSALLAPDADSAVLEWRAAETAPRFSGPVRVLVMDLLVTPPRTFPVTAPVLGRHAPPGGLLINETDVFWLSVGTGE